MYRKGNKCFDITKHSELLWYNYSEMTFNVCVRACMHVVCAHSVFVWCGVCVCVCVCVCMCVCVHVFTVLCTCTCNINTM